MLEHAYNFLLWRLTCHERTDSEDKSSSRRNSLMAFNSPKPAGKFRSNQVQRFFANKSNLTPGRLSSYSFVIGGQPIKCLQLGC